MRACGLPDEWTHHAGLSAIEVFAVIEVLRQATLLAGNVAELCGRYNKSLAVNRIDEIFINMIALVEL